MAICILIRAHRCIADNLLFSLGARLERVVLKGRFIGIGKRILYSGTEQRVPLKGISSFEEQCAQNMSSDAQGESQFMRCSFCVVIGQ